MPSRRPCATWTAGTVLLEVAVHVHAAGIRPVGPVAGHRALDQRLADFGSSASVDWAAKPTSAHRSRDALGSEAPVEVEPGDLRGQRVEDRDAAALERLKRQELVAPAVAAPDRTQPRVARAVLRTHPRRATNRISRVTSWPSTRGFSTYACPPVSPNPRWSKRARRTRRRATCSNAAGSVVREPPHPWLCRIIGTGRAARPVGPEQRVADLDRCRRPRIRDAGDAAVGHLRRPRDDSRGPGRRSGGGREGAKATRLTSTARTRCVRALLLTGPLLSTREQPISHAGFVTVAAQPPKPAASRPYSHAVGVWNTFVEGDNLDVLRSLAGARPST